MFSELLSHVSCSGVMAKRSHQYITSDQILNANCGLQGVTFRAEENLKVKFTFVQISTNSDEPGNTTETIGLLTAEGNERIPIQLDKDEDETEITSLHQNADIDFYEDFDSLLLIRFEGSYLSYHCQS